MSILPLLHPSQKPRTSQNNAIAKENTVMWRCHSNGRWQRLLAHSTRKLSRGPIFTNTHKQASLTLKYTNQITYLVMQMWMYFLISTQRLFCVSVVQCIYSAHMKDYNQKCCNLKMKTITMFIWMILYRDSWKEFSRPNWQENTHRKTNLTCPLCQAKQMELTVIGFVFNINYMIYILNIHSLIAIICLCVNQQRHFYDFVELNNVTNYKLSTALFTLYTCTIYSLGLVNQSYNITVSDIQH